MTVTRRLAVLLYGVCLYAGTSTIHLPAGQQWVDAGLDVEPGMMIEVSATGEIVLEGGRRTGPEGIADQARPAASRPLPAGRLGAVIVKVKYANGFDSNILAIGRGLQFRVEDHEYGRLYLGINADSAEHSTGRFTASVRWR
jgi:hypothetical protein